MVASQPEPQRSVNLANKFAKYNSTLVMTGAYVTRRRALKLVPVSLCLPQHQRSTLFDIGNSTVLSTEKWTAGKNGASVMKALVFKQPTVKSCPQCKTEAINMDQPAKVKLALSCDWLRNGPPGQFLMTNASAFVPRTKSLPLSMEGNASWQILMSLALSTAQLATRVSLGNARNPALMLVSVRNLAPLPSNSAMEVPHVLRKVWKCGKLVILTASCRTGVA